jgi:hypothetical protein
MPPLVKQTASELQECAAGCYAVARSKLAQRAPMAAVAYQERAAELSRLARFAAGTSA